jgi:hypothetical protein
VRPARLSRTIGLMNLTSIRSVVFRCAMEQAGWQASIGSEQEPEEPISLQGSSFSSLHFFSRVLYTWANLRGFLWSPSRFCSLGAGAPWDQDGFIPCDRGDCDPLSRHEYDDRVCSRDMPGVWAPVHQNAL